MMRGMYVPTQFREDDPAKLRAFIEAHSFATLVTAAEGVPFATHLPVFAGAELAPLRLFGHVARANPQWRHFDRAAEVLLIFGGPHAYISPFWYQSGEAVPTWNYAAVHVYGRPAMIEDAGRLEQLVKTLTSKYEGARAPELFARWPREYLARMLEGIAGFEIEVTRIEGKFKLGQNRDAADYESVRTHLQASTDPHARALSSLMQ